ncbi:MAG TPA: flippase activity-associated protein Agl23 [Anaerolineae bacterium]|nr:flippase activity-associated protein Agl23 [Anaerolineae bacterium]
MSQAIIEKDTQTQPSWLDRPVVSALRLDWEKVLYAAIFVAAVLTRFWDLGARVLSHDESLHAWYAFELYHGAGFQHTPLMHGVFRFHLNALFFALFGADDFTVRLPAAIFGVALVMSPILLRPWLGRRGALLTSVLFLISPSILYHARYIRDEPFMLLFGALLLWAILSYYRDHAPKWLFVAAACVTLLYVTMEAAFIYVAVFGVFLIGATLVEVRRAAGWGREGVGGGLRAIGAALGLFGAGLLLGARLLEFIRPTPPEDGSPFGLLQLLPSLAGIALVGLLIGGGVYYVLKSLMPASTRRSTSFNLVIVLGGLSLFMLSASALLVFNFHFGTQYQQVEGVVTEAPGSGATVWGVLSGTGNTPYVDSSFFEGGNFPSDAGNMVNVLRLLFLFVCFAGLAMGLGLWWNPSTWLGLLGIFGGIGVVLFTTIFTNGAGLGTGFVGSLGYWLVQHPVQRGGQPLGYYLFITPFYEFLPMLLSLFAYGYYGRRILAGRSTAVAGSRAGPGSELYVPIVMVWVLLAWIGFSFAGEKMPWLMTHLALPMVLLSGRLLGDWFDRIEWRRLLVRREWLAAILAPVFVAAILALSSSLGALLSTRQASAAPTLDQLNAIGSLFSGALVAVGAGAGLWVLARRTSFRSLAPAMGLAALAGLVLLTVRTAWMYNYVNYDYPTEFGVFAHGGPGVKVALEQMRQLSERTTGSPNEIQMLYDDDATWPWLWYLRDFPNKRYLGSGTPSRSDAGTPVMLLSDRSWNAVDQALGNTFNWFQFHRIWWPTEDYKRIPEIVQCPAQVTRRDGSVVQYTAYDENADGAIDATEQASGDARCNQRARDLVRALWDIFYLRDYTLYANLTGQQLTSQNWAFQSDFRLYVRKDLAAKVWDQAIGSVVGSGGEAPGPSVSDPYQARWQDVSALNTIGSAGSGAGQFSTPHGIAVAPDGSIYVADSNNHRVVKLNADGEFELTFGTWSGEPPNGDVLSPDWNPPGGTFSEPWDVAVGPDGSVYVADLWNSRVQKFDADGNFLKLWGGFSDSGQQAAGAEGKFYGPRGIAVSPDGQVYVADTGNKRVQVFDAEGDFITQFGGAGLLDGNLDEPVGIAVNQAGEVVVADTWNGRIQVFSAEGQALRKWDIVGWLDYNAEDLGRARVGKPYLGVGPDDRVYVADQAASRILVFDAVGTFQASFGQFGSDTRGFATPSGVALDPEGNILVVDTDNHRVMVFPAIEGVAEEE